MVDTRASGGSSPIGDTRAGRTVEVVEEAGEEGERRGEMGDRDLLPRCERGRTYPSGS